MTYITVEFLIPEEYFDLAIGILSCYPICGIEEKYDLLAVTFETKKFNVKIKNNILNDLQRIYKEVKIINEITIPEKNWNEEWEKSIEPIIISDRLGIAPSWKIDDLATDLKIIINPKMSFGTGSHESTRLVCKLMLETDFKGKFWIDAGTGTGILSILAAKLGACKVIAIDNNPWAIENALENVKLNNCEDKVEIIDADLSDYKMSDCNGILANLNYNLLYEQFPNFFSALKNKEGVLICSGLLITSKDEIIKRSNECGFQIKKILTENEWIALKLVTI